MPKSIDVQIIKTHFAPVSLAPETDEKGAALRISHYPGMNEGAFLAVLDYVVPQKIKSPMGVHLVELGKGGDDFYFYNLLDEETLRRHAGQAVKILFSFSLPGNRPGWVSDRVYSFETPESNVSFFSQALSAESKEWLINFAPATGGVDKAGRLRKESGSWVFAANPQWLAVPPSAPSAPPRYLFTGGAPKSGTTWVEKILNAMPDVLCCGEGNFFHANARMAVPPGNLWLPQAVHGAAYGLMWEAAITDMVFRAVHNLWPQRLIADRSPSYSYVFPKALAAFPHAKAIYTRRHPLDVAISRAFHEANFIRNGRNPTHGISSDCAVCVQQRLDQPGGPAKGELFEGLWDLLRWFLDEWVHAERNYEVAARDYPGRILAVDYESLLQDFNGEVARIMDFLELPCGEADIAAIREKTSFKELSGGRATGEQDASSFFRKGVAGDYLNYFTPQQAEDAMAYVALRASGTMPRPAGDVGKVA